jgi:hypothetical protein
MTRMDEQLEFLLSRIADADLSADERAEIRRAVEGDPACARVASEYEHLGRLLRVFRPLPRNLNWSALGTAIAGRVADSAEADASALVDRSIDRSAIGPVTDPAAALPAGTESLAGEYAAVQSLLRDWAKPLPPVDWNAFKSGVSRQIRREVSTPEPQTQRRRASLFVNWLAPLAAAAAIALAVWWPREPGKTKLAHSGIRVEDNIVVVVDTPTFAGSIQLSFDESFAEEAPPNDEPSVKAIAVGPRAGEWREADDEQYLH